jgi:AcrR family transcriptional regulator
MYSTLKGSSSAADRVKFKAGSELRERVLLVAGRLFTEGGCQNVSMRRIADEIGCSQMAMYRHFPDKDALMQQLCVDLYERFTLKLHKRFDQLENPRERLRQALRQFVTLSVKNPHHYRFAFLDPVANAHGRELRARVAEPALAYFRKNLRQALPSGTPEHVVEERLHQLIACQHGMSVLLITYPHVYQITKESALRELECVFDLLLTAKEVEQVGHE